MVLKAIIIGGGIGGLTCARAFLDAGMQVELYKKRNLDSMLSGPGGIFIQRNAMRVYELLWEGKIREQLYQQGAKILKGGFFSKKAKPLYINAPEFVKVEDLGVCILRPELQRILYDALPVHFNLNVLHWHCTESPRYLLKYTFHRFTNDCQFTQIHPRN